MNSAFVKNYRRMVADLRKAREARGVSRKEVARHLNQTPEWVGRVERGETSIKVDDFIRLCMLLKLNPADVADVLM